jgi:hypothetical protein
MPELRNIRQNEAAKAFLRLGGVERRTKKNYRMIRMPNGQLIVLPGRSQDRPASCPDQARRFDGN